MQTSASPGSLSNIASSSLYHDFQHETAISKNALDEMQEAKKKKKKKGINASMSALSSPVLHRPTMLPSHTSPNALSLWLYLEYGVWFIFGSARGHAASTQHEQKKIL